jgi:hypothetical protein
LNRKRRGLTLHHVLYLDAAMTPTNEYFNKIDQHIQFLEKIIQKQIITNSTKQELSKQLERIKKRRADPK